ncbi:MAG: tRNA-(ms[2]io[6]A)-hydroxylase [Deltaproteobacteria bacterium]|nr:tRNA-(ms[2]io[6]A)-hydroxylase [Deltaproteobacteria bacterium]
MRSRTQDAWLQRAIGATRDILVDHAHCERKAATQALMLLGRFPDVTALVEPLLDLAREELEHFELVLALLQRRGWTMESLAPSGYQAQLHALCRKAMPGKLVDLLLVAALIEARSCERFKLLAEHHPDAELRDAFGGLLAAEARHHAVFVRLAGRFDDAEAVRVRLDDLASAEVAILESMPPLSRIHA